MELIKKEVFQGLEKNWVAQSGLSKAHFDKEVSFAMQAIQKNPYLARCPIESVLRSVMNVAQTDLSLNPIKKHAYLVPRRGRGGVECCLDPGYQGYIHILGLDGIKLQVNLVYEGDEWEVDFSDDKKVTKHVPYNVVGNPKGGIRSVYSLAILPEGRHIEIMSIDEVYEIRDRSESYKAYKAGKIKSCVWISDEGEMVRKTVAKRHFKYLPTNSDRLDQAVDLDNLANGFKVTDGQISYIDSLVHGAEITSDEKSAIENEMWEYTQIEAENRILWLKERQPKDLKEQFAEIMKDPEK